VNSSRPPSASIDLRHATEESFSDRGCRSAAAGSKPGDPFSSRGPKPEEEGHQSNTLEDKLDKEIRNMEMLHQQVQKKKEKMARLADLQRQIDEATKEVRHLAQDEQERRPQHRELHREGFTTRMNGMKISIMEILLLMMLLLCQQNCRLHLGPRHTSHPSSPCMMDT
jgi:TolA-binding protein